MGKGGAGMKRRGRPLLDDPELMRMLGDDPELLAIADALVETKGAPEASRRVRPVRTRRYSRAHSRRGTGGMRKRFVLAGLAAGAPPAGGARGVGGAAGHPRAAGGGGGAPPPGRPA